VKTEIVKNPVYGPASTYLIGTVQRETVVSFLNVAYAEGYLTDEEHGKRTEQALQAKQHMNLSDAVDNLPREISRLVPGDPDPDTGDAPPPRRAPGGIRAVRCLFIASATACVCMWAVAGTNSNCPAATAAAFTGVLAAIMGLFALGLFALDPIHE
jgi:hypothetical protein